VVVIDRNAWSSSIGTPGRHHPVRALELKRTYRRLSAYDAFSLALAGDEEESILLTSDRALRVAAESEAVEVHGVLWVVDRLEESGLLPAEELFRALSRLCRQIRWCSCRRTKLRTVWRG
jgi:predicted nucleic acid-binding protein